MISCVPLAHKFVKSAVVVTHDEFIFNDFVKGPWVEALFQVYHLVGRNNLDNFSFPYSNFIVDIMTKIYIQLNIEISLLVL